MPKVSKIKAASSRPGEPTPPKAKLDKFMCTRCGRIYLRQRNNFPASQSPLYRENGGYLPVCGTCVDDLFNHYKEALADEVAAMRRVCMKFDIYWHPDIYAMVSKANTSTSRIRSYISKTNLYKYVGKTYDDTLDEEDAALGTIAAPVIQRTESYDESNERMPSQQSVEFWGSGLPAEMYFALDARYARWTGNIDGVIDNTAEARYKQICILEETINRGVTSTGKSDAATINALNTLIKDVQKGDAMNESFDDLPFGVGIRMFENARPVPKPIPELHDVDGVVRYISIWFLGHLCKMLGIKNTYCKLYEEEMERRRVERPDLDDEDDEGAFNEIFGGSNSE